MNTERRPESQRIYEYLRIMRELTASVIERNRRIRELQQRRIKNKNPKDNHNAL